MVCHTFCITAQTWWTQIVVHEEYCGHEDCQIIIVCVTQIIQHTLTSPRPPCPTNCFPYPKSCHPSSAFQNWLKALTREVGLCQEMIADRIDDDGDRSAVCSPCDETAHVQHIVFFIIKNLQCLSNLNSRSLPFGSPNVLNFLLLDYTRGEALPPWLARFSRSTYGQVHCMTAGWRLFHPLIFFIVLKVGSTVFVTLCVSKDVRITDSCPTVQVCIGPSFQLWYFLVRASHFSI